MEIDLEIAESTYITTARLARDSVSLASRFPDADGVIGVARSGIIPASIIAAQLHRPLWSVSRDRGVRPLGHGNRMIGFRSGPQRLVLVDDTAFSGAAMRAALKACRDYFPAASIATAVVYSRPNCRASIDHAHAIYPGPHWLEWNLFNGPNARIAVFDLDGVICRDPNAAEDDDGPRYLDFIRGADPLNLPRREPVQLIVTARAEQYRRETESWLTRHGVRWHGLVMRGFDRPTPANWVREIAEFKAREFLASGAKVFVESCPVLAREIARIALGRVLCPVAEVVFGDRD